jgi:hypothetical protein
MITYKHEKNRHTFAMNAEDLSVFAQIIWHWKHDPQPVGFNRRRMTAKQLKIIEDIYDLMGYPENYETQLNLNGK